MLGQSRMVCNLRGGNKNGEPVWTPNDHRPSKDQLGFRGKTGRRKDIGVTYRSSGREAATCFAGGSKGKKAKSCAFWNWTKVASELKFKVQVE